MLLVNTATITILKTISKSSHTATTQRLICARAPRVIGAHRVRTLARMPSIMSTAGP